MQARSLALVGIGLGVLALGWLWVLQSRGAPDVAALQGGGGPPEVHTVSVVATEESGTCAVDLIVPHDVDVRPGDFIVWVVDNRCSTDLQLTRFARLKPTPDTDDPIDNQPPTVNRVARAGAHTKIRTKVRPNASLGLYQYLIETNNREASFSICDMPPCPWDP